MATVNFDPLAGSPSNVPASASSVNPSPLPPAVPPIAAERTDSTAGATNHPAVPKAADSHAVDSEGAARSPLHRIQAVRLQQGVSLRTVARNTGLDTRTLRAQEDESADLKLSQLYRWQEVLDVPVSELLVESNGGLSPPVLARARLVRIMKTVAAIREQAPTPGMQRMADTLIEQLTDVMPELKDVTAWHTYGQRRSLDEVGRIVDRRISDDMFQSGWDND